MIFLDYCVMMMPGTRELILTIKILQFFHVTIGSTGKKYILIESLKVIM